MTDFSPVAEEMERQVASGLRPSLQGCVSLRGETVFEHATGPNATSDSNYLLWSSTKPLVACALLSLIEEGKAELSDRIGAHWPEFANNGKERATLAHVLSHRGGFPDNPPDVRKDFLPLVRNWDCVLEYICEMPARWEPGTDRGYHPASGWFVIGELVQRLDGRPLREALRARVLEPCGMNGFGLGEPERLEQPMLQIETNGERGAPPEQEAQFYNAPESQAALIPGAGGVTSAREMVRFYRTLLDGGRGPNGHLLHEETIRLATFPHAVGNIDRTFGIDVPWGLGFHLKHAQPSLDDCGTSATPGTFGHGGHFLVNTGWADPGKDLACCFLSNGLAPARAGMAGVHALSQAVHDIVDRA